MNETEMDDSGHAIVVQRTLTQFHKTAQDHRNSLLESLHLTDQHLQGGDKIFRNGSILNDEVAISWLVSRLRILQHLDRLETVERVCSGGRGVQDVFEEIKDADIAVLANQLSMNGGLEIVRVLLDQFPYSLVPRCLDILNSAPETVPLSSIEGVLSQLISMREQPALHRDPDWAECEMSCSILRNRGFGMSVCTEHLARLSFGWCPPMQSHLETWLVIRAQSIDKMTGMYSKALLLLKMGAKLLLKGPEPKSFLYQHLLLARQYALLVDGFQSRCPPDHEMIGFNLSDFFGFQPGQRLETVWEAVGKQSCLSVEAYDEIIVPYFSIQTELSHASQDAGKNSLTEVIVKFSQIYTEWTKYFLLREGTDFAVLGDFQTFVSVVYAIVAFVDIADASLFGLLKEIIDMAYTADENHGNGELISPNLEQLLHKAARAIRLAEGLTVMGAQTAPKDLIDSQESELMDKIKDVINKHAEGHVSEKEWQALWIQIEELTHIAGSTDVARIEYCRASLKLGYIESVIPHFEFLEPSTIEKIVLEAANSFVLNCDGQMHLAHQILHLAPDSKQAQKEIAIIDAINQIRSLGIDVSPSQVRKSENAAEIFKCTLRTVSSSSCLMDISKMKALADTLGTNLSYEQVLNEISETALRLRDPILCELVGKELMALSTGASHDMLAKIALSGICKESALQAEILAHALQSSRDSNIIPLLTAWENCQPNKTELSLDIIKWMYREQESLVKTGISNTYCKDNDLLKLQIFSTLVMQGPCAVEGFAKDLQMVADSFHPELFRTVILAGMGATCALILLGCHEDQSREIEINIPIDFMHIPLAILCYFGCKQISLCGEKLPNRESLLSAIIELGRQLVLTGDKSRVATLEDEDAMDLWSTGDLSAQKNAIRQLADRVAAKTVDKFGRIHHVDPLPKESEICEILQLKEISVLAKRCGWAYSDLEEMYLTGILFRHAASAAIGSTWINIMASKEDHALSIVSKIALDDGISFNNWEMCRFLEMCTDAISILQGISIDCEELQQACKQIYQFSVQLANEYEGGIKLRPLLTPIFKNFLSLETDANLLTDPANDLQNYVAEICTANNCRRLHSFISLLWETLNGWKFRDQAFIEYPVEPKFVVMCTAAKLMNGWPAQGILEDIKEILSLLTKGENLHFGYFLVNIDDITNAEAISPSLMHLLSSVPKNCIDACLSILVQLIESERIVGTLSLENEETLHFLKQKELERSMIAEIQGIGLLQSEQEEFSDLIRKMMKANRIEERSDIFQSSLQRLITHGNMISSSLMSLIQCVSPALGISQEALHELLISSWTKVLAISLAPFSKDKVLTDISASEGIQNIFAIVRSLDGNATDKQSLDLQKILQDKVYSTLHEFVTTQRSGTDAVLSEGYMQILEIVISLGDTRWRSWSPPENQSALLGNYEALVHSKISAALALDWPGALEQWNIAPENFKDSYSCGKALLRLLQCAETEEQVAALFKAADTIILPAFISGKFDALSESYAAFIHKFAKLQDLPMLLRSVDAYVHVFGSFGKFESDIFSRIRADLQHSDSSLLLISLLVVEPQNLDEKILTWACQIMAEHPSHELVTGVFITILSKKAFGGLYNKHHACLLRAFNLTMACLHSDLGVLIKKQKLDRFVPFRLFIIAEMVSQLTENHLQSAASAFVFEILGTPQKLRVIDSISPVLKNFLVSASKLQYPDSLLEATNSYLSQIVPVMYSFQRLIAAAPANSQHAVQYL